MLNGKMLTASNNQINAEVYSSYLYLSIAAYFQDLNLNGLAQWMKMQALEELTHAMKSYGPSRHYFACRAERCGRVTHGNGQRC